MNTTGKFSEESVSSEIVDLDIQFFPNPWTRNQWQELEPSTHTIFCWREAGRPVGFALFWTMKGDDTAHLLKILLLNAKRGTGTSQLFWSEIQRDLKQKGYQSIYLEVEAGNERAKSFYEKVGFKVLRRNKAFYTNGEDAFTMSLTL